MTELSSSGQIRIQSQNHKTIGRRSPFFENHLLVIQQVGHNLLRVGQGGLD